MIIERDGTLSKGFNRHNPSDPDGAVMPRRIVTETSVLVESACFSSRNSRYSTLSSGPDDVVLDYADGEATPVAIPHAVGTVISEVLGPSGPGMIDLNGEFVSTAIPDGVKRPTIPSVLAECLPYPDYPPWPDSEMTVAAIDFCIEVAQAANEKYVDMGTGGSDDAEITAEWLGRLTSCSNFIHGQRSAAKRVDEIRLASEVVTKLLNRATHVHLGEASNEIVDAHQACVRELKADPPFAAAHRELTNGDMERLGGVARWPGVRLAAAVCELTRVARSIPLRKLNQIIADQTHEVRWRNHPHVTHDQTVNIISGIMSASREGHGVNR